MALLSAYLIFKYVQVIILLVTVQRQRAYPCFVMEDYKQCQNKKEEQPTIVL